MLPKKKQREQLNKAAAAAAMILSACHLILFRMQNCWDFRCRTHTINKSLLYDCRRTNNAYLVRARVKWLWPGEGSPKRNWYAVARNYDTIRCEQYNLIRFMLVAIFSFVASCFLFWIRALFLAFVEFLFTYFALFKCTIFCELTFAHPKKIKTANFFWFFLLNLVTQLVTVLFPQCCRCSCEKKTFHIFIVSYFVFILQLL